MLETWREVEESEGKYWISDAGRVKSWAHVRNGKRKCRMMKGSTSKRGYKVFDLSLPSGRRVAKLHRLLYHHFIEPITSKDKIDHIDGDPLNNQLDNLRVCSHSENMQNTKSRRGSKSRYKGVSLCSSTGKWRAQIRRKGRGISHIGRFNTQIEAAMAYDIEAISHYGENAHINGILEQAYLKG